MAIFGKPTYFPGHYKHSYFRAYMGSRAKVTKRGFKNNYFSLVLFSIFFYFFGIQPRLVKSEPTSSLTGANELSSTSHCQYSLYVTASFLTVNILLLRNILRIFIYDGVNRVSFIFINFQVFQDSYRH